LQGLAGTLWVKVPAIEGTLPGLRQSAAGFFTVTRPVKPPKSWTFRPLSAAASQRWATGRVT